MSQVGNKEHLWSLMVATEAALTSTNAQRNLKPLKEGVKGKSQRNNM